MEPMVIDTNNSESNKNIKFLIKHKRKFQIVFGFGLLFLLIYRLELSHVISAFGQIKLVQFMICSFTLIPFLIFLPALMLLVLFRGMGNRTIRYHDIGKHMPFIEFTALFMPGRLGDLGFLYLLRDKAKPYEALTAVVIDKFISLIVVAVMATIGVYYFYNVLTAVALFTITCVVGGLVLFALYGGRLVKLRKAILKMILRSHVDKVNGFHACSLKLVKSPLAIICDALLTLVIIAIGAVYWKCSLLSIGKSCDLYMIFFMLVAIKCVAMVPVSVWTLGTGEAVMIFFLSENGIPAVSILAISFAQRIAYISIIVLFSGLFSAINKK